MAKTKKDILTSTEELALVQSWVKFKASLAKFVSNVHDSGVDLAFESSLDDHTHYHFDTDEAVFINDVIISPKGEVRFVVPYGSRTKSFGYKECELVNVEFDEGKDDLDNVIDRLFAESFDKTTIDDIDKFEKFLKSTSNKTIIMFNEAESYISAFKLKKDRANKYSKLPNYGLF